MKALDLAGKQFGLLTVIERVRDSHGHIKWRCLCECGSETVSYAGNLIAHGVSSCRSCANTIHGLSKTPEFKILSGMKGRCYNKNNDQYADYGGRGITVCDEWLRDVSAFYRDMGPRPSPKHTIERKNNNLGYFPVNCRWATRIEQMNNTRANRVFEHNGQKMTLSEWARHLGFARRMLDSRLRSGLSFVEAITRPRRNRRYAA